MLKSAAGWHEDTSRRYSVIRLLPMNVTDPISAARTQATEAGPFKLDGRRVSIIGGFIRIPDPYRVDTIAHLCAAVLSVLPETRAIPVHPSPPPPPPPLGTATYVCFPHVRAKVAAHRAAPGTFGMTESRRHSFLVQSGCTKKQARKSPPACETGCVFASIARFQPRTLNKQGIDRASVRQLATRR